jgi:ClpP class serine protease
VVSYVDELAASAAYWLASAADKIVTPASGMVGSIGVIATRVEESSSAESGRKVHLITSGARKADGHPTVPMSEEELAATQAKINALADVFASAVAERRGMTLAQVRGLEADVFIGADAVAKGLADRVGNLSSAVAYARELATTKRRQKTMNAVNKALGLAEDSNEAVAVATVEGLKAKAARADELEAKLAALEAKQLEQDRAAALAEGDAKGVFTPAIRALYASKTAEEIRAFVSVAPRVIAVQETGKPGPKPPQGPETGAKRFEDLSPMERHSLHQSNPEAYRALRADAEQRGAL